MNRSWARPTALWSSLDNLAFFIGPAFAALLLGLGSLAASRSCSTPLTFGFVALILLPICHSDARRQARRLRRTKKLHAADARRQPPRETAPTHAPATRRAGRCSTSSPASSSAAWACSPSSWPSSVFKVGEAGTGLLNSAIGIGGVVGALVAGALVLRRRLGPPLLGWRGADDDRTWSRWASAGAFRDRARRDRRRRRLVAAARDRLDHAPSAHRARRDPRPHDRHHGDSVRDGLRGWLVRAARPCRDRPAPALVASGVDHGSSPASSPSCCSAATPSRTPSIARRRARSLTWAMFAGLHPAASRRPCARRACVTHDAGQVDHPPGRSQRTASTSLTRAGSMSRSCRPVAALPAQVLRQK